MAVAFWAVLSYAPGAANAEEPGSWAVGASIADPVGATARYRLGDRAALQAIAGWRVLGNETIELPGPLAAVDWTYDVIQVAPVAGLRVALHGGVGGAAGFIRAGCWFDAIAEVCVERASPAALVRSVVGVRAHAVPWRLELSFDVVPAIRLTPSSYPTFLGGFGLRFVP